MVPAKVVLKESDKKNLWLNIILKVLQRNYLRESSCIAFPFDKI